MTDAQIREALKHRGRLPRAEVAARAGVSVASLSRLGLALGVSWSAMPYATNPARVEQVCDYYREHGKLATQKRFPDVRVRSVVERYGEHCPRQVRWTPQQMVMAAQIAGLLSLEQQAQVFKRPNAHAGAMRSLWVKRFGVGPTAIHGLAGCQAKAILVEGYPRTRVRHRWMTFWCQMEPWLDAAAPPFLREAVRSMAAFQAWLYAPHDPLETILGVVQAGAAQAASSNMNGPA